MPPIKDSSRTVSCMHKILALMRENPDLLQLAGVQPKISHEPNAEDKRRRDVIGRCMGVANRQIKTKRLNLECKCGWSSGMIYLQDKDNTDDSWDLVVASEEGVEYFEAGLSKLEMTEGAYRTMVRRG